MRPYARAIHARLKMPEEYYLYPRHYPPSVKPGLQALAYGPYQTVGKSISRRKMPLARRACVTGDAGTVLHQGIGRTTHGSAMHRQSWSQSLLHQGIGRTALLAHGMRREASQSLLHQGIGRTRHSITPIATSRSQSLLHQGIGRTSQSRRLATASRSQSLLHQGIGRTPYHSSGASPVLVSVPSSSGHRPDS